MIQEKKYVIFGAGDYGAQAAKLIGKKGIKFFIDNNVEKQRAGYMGLAVLPFEIALSKIEDAEIILAVSEKYVKDLEEQLLSRNVMNYKTFAQLKYEITKNKLLRRTNYIDIYNKAINWIDTNSIKGKGIINNTDLRKPYPEVTGYYIPTLMRWGYRDLAISYADWLCSIQHEDGAWYDTEDKNPYIFDSAQILKGLIAIRDLYPVVDGHIVKGCNWILSNMNEEGRLVAPLENVWGDGKTFSELIHTYCVSPIKDAGELLGIPEYVEKANQIAHYYVTMYNNQILKFDLLSHFYAYVMEAMLDLGEVDLAKEAMDKIKMIQKDSGAVPAYNNVEWVCSTGLFQLAIVWFRLGDMECGNKAFDYACKLQNESGGWYGSYISEDNSNETNTYFPNSEISWAVKYFLDALYYKNVAQFEKQAPMFGKHIDKKDGRYICLKNVVGLIDGGAKILDIGCGKGRYLMNLVKDYPDNKYYAVDLSVSVMSFFNLDGVDKRQGSLTNIPFEDDSLDMIYSCEALEHAVDISSAVKEMCRTVRSDGKIVIIDKNKKMLGYFDIEEWEQWFDENELKKELLKYCSNVEVIKDISFDDIPANGLFFCWVGTVK